MSFVTAASLSQPHHIAIDDEATFSPTTTTTASRGVVTLDLVMRHAGTQRVHIRYELLGGLHAPTVLVAGGISAGRHAASSDTFLEKGWWEPQVGAGQALDPAHCRILAIDWLGSDGTLDVPIDPADQANAIVKVLDALQIDTLAAVVGCSYGAMVGLHFAALHGDRIGQLIAISGTDRAHPYSSAWRALQRRAVALGALQCDESAGLALARELAMLSYRTPEEFGERFASPAKVSNGRVRCPAEDYLDHCGQRFADTFSPTGFLRLSESIDLHAVAPEAIHVPVTVVAIAEDRLIPIEDAYRLTERLRGEKNLRVLRSKYGHDAFLKEEDAIAVVLREVVNASFGGVA
jgi:homoserine O-acetyltransferase